MGCLALIVLILVFWGISGSIIWGIVLTVASILVVMLLEADTDYDW